VHLPERRSIINVSNQRRTRYLRSAASPLAALSAALVVLAALVGPVLAVQGPTKLFDPVVSPRTGAPTTTITFEVGYRNREGSAPEFVSVVIDGTAHRMTSLGGTSWKTGVRSRWSTTLRAGTHTVSFTATSRDKFSDTVSGGTVTITVAASPAPTPKPTPRPTTKPTPAPTPTPDSGPASAPTPAPAGTATSADPGGPPGSGASTDELGGDPSDIPGPVTDDTATGGDSRTGSWWSDGSSDGSGRSTGLVGAGAPGMAGPGPGSTDGGGSGPADPTSGSTTAGDGRGVVTGGPGWGALATALAALGIDRPPAITMLPMLVGTSTAMTMAFAFAIFGKKRRDEQPPAADQVLQANAARGLAVVPGSDVVNGVVRGATVAPPLDLEAGMPRWRRPSLLEARKADPTRSTASSHRMSFENGVVGPVEGRERRVVRYAVVRLLDAPDELRSAEIGQLDQGDEVQLMERSGTYWLVLCPDGRQGWLHKMTLGEIVSDAASTGLAREIDDDVLSAFLAARAQA
jgi:hypothetical protein